MVSIPPSNGVQMGSTSFLAIWLIVFPDSQQLPHLHGSVLKSMIVSFVLNLLQLNKCDNIFFMYMYSMKPTYSIADCQFFVLQGDYNKNSHTEIDMTKRVLECNPTDCDVKYQMNLCT